MNLSEALLPRDAPLSEKFEQIGAWLWQLGYETRHQGGQADDSDWDVTFIPDDYTPGQPCPVWTFHGETRQGLARTLVRYVTRRDGR